MDGAHDMGGVKGFGPVVPEPNEPVFHEEWERRALALTIAMARPGGFGNPVPIMLSRVTSSASSSSLQPSVPSGRIGSTR